MEGIDNGPLNTGRFLMWQEKEVLILHWQHKAATVNAQLETTAN